MSLEEPYPDGKPDFPIYKDIELNKATPLN